MKTLTYFFLFFVPILILTLLNSSDGFGLDAGLADCVGLRNGLSNGIFASNGAELIEGPNVRTGDGIDDDSGLGHEPCVGTVDGLDLAEGLGIGTGDGIKRVASELRGAARRAERLHVRIGGRGSD